MQKKWIDLLGLDDTNCFVMQKYIVRQVENKQYRVLRKFDTRKEAIECFNQWLSEIAWNRQISQRLP